MTVRLSERASGWSRDLRFCAGTVALRARRLVLRRRILELAEATLASFDREAFIERFRPFWNPFPTHAPSKFLDLRIYVPEAASRAIWCGVPNLPRGSRVLDLGCGTGYFLVLCRELGHDVVGLDLDGEPLFNAMVEHFRLPRVVHRIQPCRALPDLGAPFDLVTAFLTCFDRHEDGSPWTAAEWASLLADLRGRLTPRGRCVFLFNRNPLTGEYTSRAVRRAIAASPGFRARFFHHYLTLTAV